MKIFLSSLEHGIRLENSWLKDVKNLPFRLKYNLVSYYYLKNSGCLKRATCIRDNSELMLVDSGAHSFQKGKRVEWETYVDKYAKFIQTFDKPNILGFFEIDIDTIVGYPRVLELRRKLMNVSNKIIPVWHKGRGIAEMCAKRLQLQERLGKDILEVMTKVVGNDVAVRIQAEHSCVTARGIKKPGTKTVTLETSGIFDGIEEQERFLNMLKG